MNTFVTVPRHARILPSFAVRFVGRSLKCSIGTINKNDLLAWSGALPSAYTTQEIRKQFIAGRRNTFEKLWEAPIEVVFSDSWEGVLGDTERVRMRALLQELNSPDALPMLTLREAKVALRLPVEAVLGLLAKLEAIYWSPSMARAGSLHICAQGAAAAMQEVSESWRQEVRIALSSTWIQRLDPNDIRFPSAGSQSLADWVQEQILKPILSPSTIELCNTLVAADKYDWRTELQALAKASLHLSRTRPRDAEAAERWESMLVSRFGGIEGRTLQQVGDSFSVTRERVRQICDSMLEALQSAPAMMPALDKVLGAAARIAPMHIDEVNVQLAPLLGKATGLLPAIEFSELLGRETPARSVFTKARTSEGYQTLRFVQAEGTEIDWIQKAIALARKDCRAIGCTNYLRIAGHFALHENRAVDQETLQGVFENVGGYRLLDRTSGWFTVAGSEECAVATRLRKLLSIANTSVGIDTLLSALITDERWIREGGTALSLPPLHVMSELLAGWSWLYADGHNKYRSKEKLKPPDVLSALELSALEILRAHEGVVTRTDLAKVIVSQLGYSDVALSLALSASPIFSKLEHSIYSLNSHPISLSGLSNARNRRMRETSDAETALLPTDLNKPFNVTMTQSNSMVAASRRVVYLPSAFSQHIEGHFRHDGGVWPSIAIRPNLQIYKLSSIAAAQGILPKQRFEVTFDLTNRTYDIYAELREGASSH